MSPTVVVGNTQQQSVAKNPQPNIEQLNRRRYERERSNVPARVLSSRGLRHSSVPARIVDQTPIGFAIEVDSAKALVPGSDITLFIENLPGTFEKNLKLQGTVRTQRSERVYGVALKALVKEQVEKKKSKSMQWVSVAAAVLVASIILLLKSRNVVSFWYGPVIQTYSIGAALFVISRVLLSMKYKAPKDNSFFPTVSLIVAVKNEEAYIAETVKHCLDSRYPKEKFEVIVIDDGSTDNTWEVLKDVKAKNDRVRVFQFSENRGKRHAMALGSREATGDILVFIDSDTFLEEEAIYRLVQPFADARVGAVAGHTLVIVEENNLISKMEAVRYYVSQRVMKAAESVFNAVTCCPGPLSGYRRSAVMPILDHWENQMFLGAKATFGDDRSLTNYILRDYRVVYHADARCATYTPNKMSVFIRQQLRWKKSWIRELTVAVRFMWKKHPIAAISYYASMVITLISPLVAFGALFGFSFIGVPFNFVGYLSGLLLAYVFLGLIFHYHTQSKYWAYGIIFALMYVCIFSFQNYYALLTMRKNQWGTR